jgi:ubiquitin C-terminal hydrolase
MNIEPIGLDNIGNTCYMNSALQLLINSPSFVSFLLKNDDKSNSDTYLYKASINRVAERERKRLKLSEDDIVSINRSDIDRNIKKSITRELSNIITSLCNSNTSIRPIKFKKRCDKLLPSFQGCRQHDAHEFLIQLINLIIEETGIETNTELSNLSKPIKKYFKIKNIINDLDDNDPQKIELSNKLVLYCNKNKSILNKIDGINYYIELYKKKYNPLINSFHIIYNTSFKCSNCNNILNKYENNTILTLELCDNLYESFDNFTSEEIISDFSCSNCKQNHPNIKSCSLWRFPITLFIHLKRFKYTSSGRYIKDNSPTIIPKILNLSKYCNKLNIFNDAIIPMYELGGISHHYGSINGGHYTADCKAINSNNWYKLDDSFVSKYNQPIFQKQPHTQTNRSMSQSLQSQSAYILRYDLLTI